MHPRLDLSEQDFREFANSAIEMAAEYYHSLPHRKVMPEVNSRDLREVLNEPMPRTGVDQQEIFRVLRDVIFAGSRHNGHPRFFGYVASPGNAVAALADLMASTLNTNLTSWRSGPAPTEVEHVVIRWMKQIFGYPDTAMGLLVSGGSAAHLSALAAARAAKSDTNVARSGMRTVTRALRIYMSEEGHFSITKAASLLGIGSENVERIPTDDTLRIDLGLLEERIKADLAAGHRPMCIVANEGAVGAGAVDPIADLAAIARRYDVWLHADAAYGGFAALAPSVRNLFQGIELADSIAVDPHKWLYSSFGCGCVLYRDATAAYAAFAEDAEYTRTVGLINDEAFAFWNYGPELSRRFRALNIWMLLKYAGADAIADAIEANVHCAKYFEQLVKNTDDFEMLAPVTLSVFCFRYKNGLDLDALNERILAAVQRDGSSYISNTRVKGQFALRGCVLNFRTTEEDMRRLLEDVRRVALEIAD